MKVYFMGIAGTAMGNAACLLRQAGHTVLGSDTDIYPPMSTLLEAAGIEVLRGYDAARLAALAPDLVVIGNAQSRGNPEVEWLLDTRALPFTSLPEVLSSQVLAQRQPVVIAGTHGKTTTTALTAHLLAAAGVEPGWLIGGAPLTPDRGAELGAPGAPFAIEGDEYDSAFFDKRSKFIHYRPKIAALTAVELDHIDIFLGLDDYLRTFRHFTRILPRSGWIVANGDDPNCRAILQPVDWTNTLTVGSSETCTVRIEAFSEDSRGAHFATTWGGRPWFEQTWSLYGAFNARNAVMAATCAALALRPGDPTSFQPSALANFRGVRRRQEHRFESAPLIIVEDFGHHPTALRETLASLRARHPGRKLWAAFEPRSNSARTEVFREGFENALAAADRVWLGAIGRSSKLAAAGPLATQAMADALSHRGIPALALAANSELVPSLARALDSESGGVVLVLFSNGSFDGAITEAVDVLGLRFSSGSDARPRSPR